MNKTIYITILFLMIGVCISAQDTTLVKGGEKYKEVVLLGGTQPIEGGYILVYIIIGVL